MSEGDALLPFVDAWSIDIDAPPRVAWEALLGGMMGSRDTLVRRALALVLDTDPAASNGLAPHVIGAERAGFTVCEVVPPVTYALAGRHRFARYQLVFRVSQREPAGSRLTAETYASFPGTGGGLYRLLLMDAKSHALVMWIMMRVLRRRARAAARRQDSNIA